MVQDEERERHAEQVKMEARQLALEVEIAMFQHSSGFESAVQIKGRCRHLDRKKWAAAAVSVQRMSDRRHGDAA